MRKRSIKEILQLVEVSYTDPLALSGSGKNPSISKREKEIASKQASDDKSGPPEDQKSIRRLEADARLKNAENREKALALRAKKQAATEKKAKIERQKAKIAQRSKTVAKIAGGKVNRERTSSKEGSVSATGKVGMNLLKTGAKAVRNVASIPARLAVRSAKSELGKQQMSQKDPVTGQRQAPDAGTKTQKAKYIAGQIGKKIKKSTEKPMQNVGSAASSASQKVKSGVGSAVKATRQVAGDAVQSASNVIRRGEPKKTVTGNRIRQAVKNVRSTAAKPIQSISDKIRPNNIKREHTSYTQFAMFIEDYIHEAEKGDKQIKKEKMDVMKGTNKIEVNPKVQAEAKVMTKKQIKKRDEIADAISTREMNKRYGDKNVKYAIATKLAMKKKKKSKIKEDVSGIEVQNVSDGIKFREYEFIDVVKPEPMRSPKNNITWTEGRRGGGTSGQNMRNPNDNVSIGKKYTQDGKMGIELQTPDEQIAKRQQAIEDAKKSPEKLKRERQLRLMMKGKFKTNRRSRQ